MKNIIFYTLLATAPFFISTTTTSDTIADEVTGIYSGMYASHGELDKSFQVKVVKIDDKTVEITPVSNKAGKTFRVELKEGNMSAIRVIRLNAVGDVILQNGMITPNNGRLSYAIAAEKNGALTVFSGVRNESLRE